MSKTEIVFRIALPRRIRGPWLVGLGLLVVIGGTVAWATIYTPQTYNPGDKLSSAKLNTEFTNIGTAVNGLDTRVHAVETNSDGVRPVMSKSATQAQVANGSCLTITHNWGTNAVTYSAWMTDPTSGNWVPVQPGYDAGTTNLALQRPASQSSYAHSDPTVYGPSFVNDGILSGQVPRSCLATAGSGWWQVDLGSVQPLSYVRLLSDYLGDVVQDATLTGWNVLLSLDGVTFGAPAASGVCVDTGSCGGWIVTNLPPGSSARYVQIQVTASYSLPCVTEVEVYSAHYTVSQPDANSIKFCNYTGITRDLALTVSH